MLFFYKEMSFFTHVFRKFLIKILAGCMKIPHLCKDSCNICIESLRIYINFPKIRTVLGKIRTEFPIPHPKK